MSVMKQDKNEYKNYVDKISPKPSYVKNYIMAFLVGGLICCIGQGINDFYMKIANLEKLQASSATSMTLIFTYNYADVQMVEAVLIMSIFHILFPY